MATVAHQPEPITRQGYERLRAELEYLVTVRRRQMADDLREAREDGGEPGENLGVTAVLDDQAALERRIDELEAALAAVQVVDPPADGVAGIGQRVRLRLGDAAEPIEYELVGALEADPAAGRVSAASPLGRALLGREAGAEAVVEAPRGVRRFEIVSIAGEERRGAAGRAPRLAPAAAAEA